MFNISGLIWNIFEILMEFVNCNQFLVLILVISFIIFYFRGLNGYFVTDGVTVGDVIYNTIDFKESVIISVDNETQLTLKK